MGSLAIISVFSGMEGLLSLGSYIRQNPTLSRIFLKDFCSWSSREAMCPAPPSMSGTEVYGLSSFFFSDTQNVSPKAARIEVMLAKEAASLLDLFQWPACSLHSIQYWVKIIVPSPLSWNSFYFEIDRPWCGDPVCLLPPSFSSHLVSDGFFSLLIC